MFGFTLPSQSVRRGLIAQAGFTMIELLVVIAVIGVLAVAVLSSINPIEQINKGRDTRTQSDSAQLINAVDRYFSIAEEYPWNTTTATYDAGALENDYEARAVFDETGLASDDNLTDWTWSDILVTNNEVKAGFVNRLESDDRVEYYIEKDDGTNATMFMCFLPSSNAFKDQALEACQGTLDGDFPQAIACPDSCRVSGDKDTCMICLP